MRKSVQGRCRSLSLLALLALFLFSPATLEESALAATPASSLRASAMGITGANAQLNGARLIPGATLFRGDVVTLGADSSAALQFEKDLVLAAPWTEFVVEAGGIRLRSGRVQIRLAGADSFSVSGPFFSVKVAPSGGTSGSAEILVGGKQAQVSAVAGVAELLTRGMGTPHRLNAGEVATMEDANGEAGGGQAGSVPAAGQLSRLQPDVQIGRASQQLVASLAAPVYWKDDLRSGASGRARVSLTDGSLLNLGSNSELIVLQHDAQAQQTSLDLAVGRMRGQVIKLSRPGAKFEIRTPAGVAGLVGTDFYLSVTPDYTDLIVFEGAVNFTSTASGQPVTTSSGMKVRISQNGAITGPSVASLQEIQQAKDSTDVPEMAAQQPQHSGQSPGVPIVISVLTGGAVIGIGLALSARETVSPPHP